MNSMIKNIPSNVLSAMLLTLYKTTYFSGFSLIML